MLGVEGREDPPFFHPTLLPAGGLFATGKGVLQAATVGGFLQLSRRRFWSWQNSAGCTEGPGALGAAEQIPKWGT